MLECGCPPDFSPPSAPSWCGNVNEQNNYASYMTSTYCQESDTNCASCGTWCAVAPSPPSPPLPPTPPPVPPRSPTPPSPPPGFQSQHGYATRYWDCCKPSCSWLSNVPTFLSPARHCDASGTSNSVDSATNQAVSACEAGGDAYTCIDHTPTTDANDPSVAYAFAATPGTDPRGTCGACFNVSFPGAGHYSATDAGSLALAAQGKTLFVMATNIGYDVAENPFDVMILPPNPC